MRAGEIHQKAARRDEVFGPYRIIAARTAVGYQAAIYAGMRLIERLHGDSVEAAFATAAEAARGRIARLRVAREAQVPSVEEYRDALDAVPLAGSARLASLLGAHSGRPGATASVAELAQAIGADAAAVRLEYARLGRKLVGMLSLPAPDEALGRDAASLASFAIVDDPLRPTSIRLRPEFVEALRAA